MAEMICPLCRAGGAAPLFETLGRVFWPCDGCGLVFVRPEDRPDPVREKAHYLSHQNHPDDDAYRAFLDRLLVPLIEKLPPGAEGIDFGSGPGPTASAMLTERGHPTEIYDPFFAPDPAVLNRAYDFVACSETVEHFHRPSKSFGQLDALLKPGGWLGVMTEMVDDRLGPDWWYLRDPTHVCFYAARTMQWIAQRFGWTMASPQKNVVLFQKPG